MSEELEAKEPELATSDVRTAREAHEAARRKLRDARAAHERAVLARWVTSTRTQPAGEHLAASRFEPISGRFRTAGGRTLVASDENGPALPHRREQARLAEEEARAEYEDAREEYFEARRAANDAESARLARDQVAIAKASKEIADRATALASEQVAAAKALNDHTKWLKIYTLALVVIPLLQVGVAVSAAVHQAPTPDIDGRRLERKPTDGGTPTP